MNIITMTLGELGTSCYLVSSKSKNAAMIDPAGNADYIMSTLEKNNLTLKMILLTHGHFDHTGAVSDLVSQTGAKVYIHKNDECMLDDTNRNVAYLAPGFVYKPFSADVLLSDGDKISLDEIEFRVMLTPGHTAGSVMYFAENCIFSGDTIFEGSVGRTDFYSGDFTAQRESLKKIADLEGDYIIYPGHGGSTTLKQEKKYNPYLTVGIRADFFDGLS